MRSKVMGIALAVAALGAARAGAAERLEIGYLPVTGHAKFFVAKEQGFFEKEGLDVELVEFVNSADGINALVAGKIDVGAFGTTAPLVHIARGTDLRIIGGVMGEDAAIVTAPANAGAIRAVGDLRGRKIATVRLASGDAVLRGALHDAGIDWRKDVRAETGCLPSWKDFSAPAYGRALLEAAAGAEGGEVRARLARLVEWLTIGGGVPGCMHGGGSPDGARLAIRGLVGWEGAVADARRIAGLPGPAGPR